MKKIQSFIFIWILLNSYLIVQAQSFESDWKWLKLTEKINGINSRSYEKALYDLVANNMNDSSMVLYYDSIAIRLNTIIPQIENKYGITSTEYGKLIDVCNAVIIRSADKHIKLKKRKQLVNFLKSLEKSYHQAGENEYIFLVALSNVYSYIGDQNKAFHWSQKRFEYAKEYNNINELAAAYGALVELYATYRSDDKFAQFLNELIGDNSIPFQNKRFLFNYILDSNYEILSDRNKSDIVSCMLKSKETRILDIQILCHQASKQKDYYIFDIIEKSKWFYDLNIEDKFNYYKRNSTVFAAYDNPQRCIDYLLKAIDHAQTNNRDDLNWDYHGSESTVKTHNWDWVAFYYENGLSDRTNALIFLEKNLTATKEYYGENSSNYYNEVKLLAGRYNLWHNNIEKATQYDSIATEVSKQVFGIESEEYVNSLSSYIFDLRRQNKYSIALSLCDDYLSNVDTKNVYLHKIYNQAAMCYEALGMDEDALMFFFKAIENTEDRNDKSTYAINMSSLLVDGINAKPALEFVEKYQPKTNNPVDHYNFINTKANILANIDRNKAYKTFCEAEQYENSKNVRLMVNRQIYHYMDKAKVAPDLHLRFLALQQALKVFDNNNTADSIMYAHIIADMADYYDSVMNVEKATQLYNHASDVYIRNNKEISIDFLDFCDRVVMFGLSHRYDPQFVYAAEQSLAMRKQMQGEMNPIYIIRRFQMLDTYSRFGYDAKADSLAEEIILDQIPSEYVQEKNYYLGLYEQYSRKDLKKAAVYYEDYLSSTDFSIGGTRLYGDLMDIYKELGEYDKYDNIEDKYITTWCQDIESKWYHITDQERRNFLQLLTGWQIDLAMHACTPKSIENAANASLFCKGRLTQTTKAINEELSRLEKPHLLSDTSSSHKAANDVGVENTVKISEHIISKQDSTNREIIYNDLSITRLKDLVNSSIIQVKKMLIKGDVGIDFIRVDNTTIYAYIIKKDKPVELKRLSLATDYKTLTKESLEDISLNIKSAKRVFFSPSEKMSISPIELFFRDTFPNVEIHRVLSLSDIHEEIDTDIKNVVAIGNPRFNDELTTKSQQDRGSLAQPLPGTKIEIDSISNMLIQNNIKIYAYTENDATESVVKKFNKKDIDLIHIATHGFYNSDKNESGLLFSGANRSLNGDSTDSVDDGILTCDEIENLYFPDLKLVVLSACETGLGETNIDGVWGLQRAFRIAGAQNIIVSLKKVDDELTQAFMIDFYRNLTNGDSIYKSFWKAMDNADEETRNSFILIE